MGPAAEVPGAFDHISAAGKKANGDTGDRQYLARQLSRLQGAWFYYWNQSTPLQLASRQNEDENVTP
jgi:hypothetical protein